MSRRARVCLAVWLVLLGVLVGVLARPLSGGTIAAWLLIGVGGWWLVGLVGER